MKISSVSWNTHIAPQTKQQAAYHTLKTAIISLDLPPNTVLIENYIMERFNLSRTPMREAIARLLTEGFLSNAGSKGFMVNDIQYRDFLEIYEVKEALESEAAYLCCARKRSAGIAKIEAAYQRYEDALPLGDYVNAMLLDLDYHWSIVENSGNQCIIRQMSLVMDQTLKFFNMYYTDDVLPQLGRALQARHKSMLEAIKGDDPNAARQAVIQHIQEVMETNRTLLF